MDIARLNMSHGTHEQHEEVYGHLRAACDATGRGIGILADLQGPKIRVGRFAEGPVRLTPGDEFTITTDDVPGGRKEVSTSYQGLPGDVHAGDTVLIDDGRVALEVIDVDGTRVRTRVVVGGMVSDNKGLNLPGVAVSVPALTDKDEVDLRWALHLGVDLVALSFVRGPADAESVYKIMEEEGVRVPLLGKIEKPQAVEHLPEVVAAFDGIMVARGDLGVELPLEQVPIVQKRAIELAREKARPVIVATQMLESMISAPRPTRAEASDVANAVFEGADAVMLSAESAAGAYPIEAVQTMSHVAEEVENSEHFHSILAGQRGEPDATPADAISASARQIAETLGIAALVCFTASGATGLRAARERPSTPILALSPNRSMARRLALVWGIHSVVTDDARSLMDLVQRASRISAEEGFTKPGDRIIITAGVPFGTAGVTNLLRIASIGADGKSGI